MATDAASSETTATATVVRATERQVRLKLGKALGGREVTKRVAVPEEVRETIEGAVVPIVVTGSGDKAKVELAQGWAAAIGGGAKKPAARRTRGAKAKAAEQPAEEAPKKTRTRGTKATKAPAAKDEDAPKTRTRGAKAKADDAPKSRTRKAKAESPSEAPNAKGRGAKETPAGEASSSRSRRGGSAKPTVKAIPPVSPALIRKQIAAAVELVRGARR